MGRIFVTTMLLLGAVALPAVSAVNMTLDFPRETPAAAAETGDFWLFDTEQLPIILAQSTEPGCQSNCGSDYKEKNDPAKVPPPPGVSPDAIGITPAATKKIVDDIASGAKFCELITKKDKRLIIDCLADQYRFIALRIPADNAYSGVRNALFNAGTKLHQLASDHHDGSPKVKATNGGRSSHTKLTPIKNPERFAPEAAAIIEEATTVLLRSSQGSDQRRLAYEAVSAVVDSNKVLLRSA